MDLLGLLTGGSTGLIGAVLGRAVNALGEWQRQRSLDKNHVREMELARLRSDLTAQEREKDLQLATVRAESDLRIASYKHEADGTPSQYIVDALKLVRPVLTVMLLFMCGLIFLMVNDPVQEQGMIDAISWLATVALTWWFGSRTLSKPK